MSGGSFDYAYSRVVQFANELDLKLSESGKQDEWGSYPYQFEPATLTKLREIEAMARKTAGLMREAEWLYSGDTGDKSFMERVAEIEGTNAELSGREEKP